MSELKIEAGKCYRTRDGRKAHVMFRHPYNHPFPYVGYVEDNDGVSAWTDAGFYSVPSDRLRLISEWKEPRKGEVWVNVWEDGICNVHDTAKQSESAAEWISRATDKALIARVSIPWTEGQGLPDNGSGE